MVVYIEVFWDVISCKLSVARCGLLDPEDGGSMSFQNGNNYFPVTWHIILKNLNHQHCENLKSCSVPGFVCATVFIRVQDGSTANPQKNKSAKGKCIYPNTVEPRSIVFQGDGEKKRMREND